MITIILLISIFLSTYYFVSIFHLNRKVYDRMVFLSGVVMGFILSLPPIYTIHHFFNDTFGTFGLKYNYNVWGGFFEKFYNVFLHVGVLEEGTKFIIVLITILLFHLREFKVDKYSKLSLIFLLFAGTSLGFSIIENVTYAYQYNDWVVIILRALISTVIHVLCGVEMGYGFFKVFLMKKKLDQIKWIIYAVLVPITIHAFYDSIIKTNEKSLIYYFIIIGTIFSYQWIQYRIFLVRHKIKRP